MITKSLVKDEDRLGFLPLYLGAQCVRFEQLVYGFMDHFCKAYSGGYWSFWTLSNGGILMSLDSEQVFDVINEMNCFEGSMSADSVSIAVNMFALNTLMCEPHDDRLIDYYYALRDLGCEHPESSKFLSFID